MKHCGYCGRQIDENVKFCPYCGRQPGQATPGQAAPAAKKNCGQCGRAMPATARFCPYCGGRVGAAEAGSKRPEKPSRSQKAPRPPKKRRWIAAVAAALVVCIGVGGFLAYKQGKLRWPLAFQAQNETGQSGTEIYDYLDNGIQPIVAPYLNDDNNIEYDESLLNEAGNKVFAWAKELAQAGKIQDAAYCDESYTVSFFLNDGTTYVYSPSIEGCYSSGSEICIGVIDNVPFLDKYINDIPYTNPAKTIKKEITSATSKQFGTHSTIEEIKQFFLHLNEDHVRAIFWRGHGNIYKARNGETVFYFMVGEKVTKKNKILYKGDVGSVNDECPSCIVTGGKEYALTYKFFDKYMCKVNGGLFFAGACYSVADNKTMANTLLDKGFDAYVGSNNSINIPYSNAMLSDTAKYLTQKDDEGRYNDIETALSKAMSDNNTKGFHLLNDKIGSGGQFELVYSAPFRLIDSRLYVEFKPKDNTVDLNRISVLCSEIHDDGTVGSLGRLSGDEVKKGVIIPNPRTGSSYQFDISYNSFMLRRATIDDFGTGIDKKIIELSVAFLDIIVQDKEGTFNPDANVEIFGDNPDNGIRGLVQKPIVQKNDQREDVYRLPVEPGTYHIRITPPSETEDAGMTDEIRVEGNTTRYYTLEASKDRETNAPPEKPGKSPKPTKSSKPTNPPKAKTDYAAIFRAKMDELVDRYGAMAGEPQVKTVGREYNWAPIWTSHESEGMLFGDVFDYDSDGAPELLTMRNAPGQGDSNFFDLLFLEIYEVKDGACVLSDTANISAQGLSMGGWAGTGVSAFRYSLNGAPAIGVLCETDSGMDWVVATLSYGYTGELLLMNNGVKYGSWPGAYAEEGEEGGYLSACFEAVSEKSALYTSANGDTFEHWKVVANSGQNSYDAQVNDVYWKYLGKIGLTPRRGGALSDRLLQAGRFQEQSAKDYIRYHSAADSLEALEGDLTMLGNITNEYFIESDIYFARDYLYEDMQEFIAVGNLATGSYDQQAQPSQPTLVPVELPPVPHFDNEPAATTRKPEASADDSEKALRKKVLEAYSGSGDIQAFGYSDFDWDGRHEAFALIGVYNDSTWENTCELWFVSPDTCTRLEKDKGYYPYESAIVTEGGYACFTVSEGYFGSGSTLRLWTVLDGQPVLHSQREYAGQSGEISREVYLEDRDSDVDADSGDTGHGGTVKVREASLRSNVRTGPGLGYDTIGELTGSTELEFLNETSIDDRGVTWYKVRFKGRDGWVSEKYTKLTTH